ncbi:hypothetical protein [Litoribaculum gwangyangense]
MGNAQSNSKTVEVEVADTISVSKYDLNSTDASNVKVNTVKENENLLIDTIQLRASIARSSSDIRIYLIRKRNEGNISLVFPKINKAVKA